MVLFCSKPFRLLVSGSWMQAEVAVLLGHVLYSMHLILPKRTTLWWGMGGLFDPLPTLDTCKFVATGCSRCLDQSKCIRYTPPSRASKLKDRYVVLYIEAALGMHTGKS